MLTSQITQLSRGWSAGWSNSVPQATQIRLSWSIGVRVVVSLAIVSSDWMMEDAVGGVLQSFNIVSCRLKLVNDPVS